MSKVRLGPLSEVHVHRIQDRLKAHGASAERFEDPELLKSFSQVYKENPITVYPSFSGLPEFIFIEVEREHLLLIKEELDHIGISLKPSVPVESVEEFICPRCERLLEAPGQCPKDGENLIPYFEYKNEKFRRRQRRFEKGFVFFVLGFVLVAFVAILLKKEGSFLERIGKMFSPENSTTNLGD